MLAFTKCFTPYNHNYFRWFTQCNVSHLHFSHAKTKCFFEWDFDIWYMHLFADLFSNGCRSVLMITLYNMFHILVPLFCHKNRFSAACNVSCCNMAYSCMWMVGRSAEVSSYRPDLDRRQRMRTNETERHSNGLVSIHL